MATRLVKLAKVNDSITVNRYDNGWMVEISGKDSDGEWKTSKIIANTEADLVEVIKAYNSTDLDN